MNQLASAGLSSEARAALALELRRLEGRLSVLSEERQVIEAALARTDAQIEACHDTMGGILGLIGGAVVDAKHEEESGPAPILNQSGHRNVGESIIDAVAAVFAERECEPMHYRELADVLASRGVTLGGKNSAGTLLAVLTNSKYSGRFERCGRGIYRPVTSEHFTVAVPKEKPRKSRRRRRIKKGAVNAAV